MLAERLETLFALLTCSNADIASWAHLSPSTISRVKGGSRAPGPDSSTIARLADGVCSYADYEGLMPVLCDLCGAASQDRTDVTCALVEWLFADEGDVALDLQRPARTGRAQSRREFGKRLDTAMGLLGITNSRLAHRLHVDPSLISRFRNGQRTLRAGSQTEEDLVDALIESARTQGKHGALARLCKAQPESFGPSDLASWLFSPVAGNYALAGKLLEGIGAYTAPDALPALPASPSIVVRERYWGMEGLREAVARFLVNAAREGGELRLYSNEDMSWMTGDPAFFGQWRGLMAQCAQAGVRVRIIHNFDRDMREMVDAILGWIPLYMTGVIEPFAFPGRSDGRFCNTLFLRVGAEAVAGSMPAGAEQHAWHDYICDPERTSALERFFDEMERRASPVLKVYAQDATDEYASLFENASGHLSSLLAAPSVGTMPNGLLERMLARVGIKGNAAAEALALRARSRALLHAALADGGASDFLKAPAPGETVHVNFGKLLSGLRIAYTPGELAAHLSELARLVRQERRYHLSLVDGMQLPGVQMTVRGEVASAVRENAPHVAFVFENTLLTDAFREYSDLLDESFRTDRFATCAALADLREQLADVKGATR